MDEKQRQLSAALGRLPSGLFILTMRRGEQETGFLTSWVQQCSFEPPQISLAVKEGRPILAWLVPGARFMLNILDNTQTDMVAHFGRGFALEEPAFEEIEVERQDGSAPVLAEALAYLHCRVVARYRAGDHELFVAGVFEGRVLGEGQPMVHLRKSGAHY